MDTSLLLLSIIIGINFFVGLGIIFHDPRKIVNQNFFLFILGITLWAFSIIAIFAFKNFSFNTLIFFGFILAIIGIYNFSQVFPAQKNFSPRHKWYIIPALLLFIGIPFNLYVKDIAVSASGAVQPVNGPGMPVFAFVCLAYLIAAIYSLIRRYFHLNSIDRVRVQYFFFWCMRIFCLRGSI